MKQVECRMPYILLCRFHLAFISNECWFNGNNLEKGSARIETYPSFVLELFWMCNLGVINLYIRAKLQLMYILTISCFLSWWERISSILFYQQKFIITNKHGTVVKIVYQLHICSFNESQYLTQCALMSCDDRLHNHHES